MRSLHLVGIAGIGAGFIQSAPESQWLAFWYLAIISGGMLMALYLWTSMTWLLQAKGVVILLKLALLALAAVYPAWRAELFVAIIALSSFIAHAPGSVRAFGWQPGEQKVRKRDSE